MTKFKIGELVRLRSGGPKMTVKMAPDESMGLEEVLCVWFKGDLEISESYHPDMLVHVNDDDE